MPSVSQVNHAATLTHLKRVRRMLELGSLNTGLIGVWWGVFFAFRSDWAVVGLDSVAIALSAGSFLLVRLDRLRQASFLYVSVVYALTVLTCIFVDVPSAQTPRSIHLFLPSLAVCAYLLFRGEKSWVRNGVPAACLLTFAFFDASQIRVGAVHELPESIRAIGIWVDEAFALVCLFITIVVMQADIAERSRIELDLRNALIRGELLLHYQPQVGERGELIGAEALIRWKHPTRGLVSPGEFIPLAEACGLMPMLGEWVLRTACHQLVRWQATPATRAVPLAVNVSASQFSERDFVERVESILHETGASPFLLKLELTESVLADDLDDVVAKMAKLKATGIRFSLDDFGTGFSSLSYLQRLPLDQLKIDQSFVRNLTRSNEDESIAKAVVALGKSLGLDVIAEGVETAEHRDFLAAIGCVTYQGYLFSKPLPLAQFESFAAGSVAVAAGAVV